MVSVFHILLAKFEIRESTVMLVWNNNIYMSVKESRFVYESRVVIGSVAEH